MFLISGIQECWASDSIYTLPVTTAQPGMFSYVTLSIFQVQGLDFSLLSEQFKYYMAFFFKNLASFSLLCVLFPKCLGVKDKEQSGYL